MEVTALVNARRREQAGLWTIRIEQGRLVALEAQDVAGPKPDDLTAPGALDARGGLVTPALIDAHIHLDLAYSLALVPPHRSGTLFEAIALWSQIKPQLSATGVRERAERALRVEVGFGTGFLRAHVDVSSAAGLRLCEGVLAACDATRDICKVQLVAFPQDGLVCDPQAVDLVRQALRAGVDLVGGIPHIERVPRDGLRHLELVFDLAAEFDAPIDVHIDESDDPQSMYTEYLAALTIERGWQGRVTASHVCALSSYTHVHAARVMDLLAEARINVVTNPGLNLFLQGRFDRYPKRRGLTRVTELLDRGVKCAAGQDCINDPFYPFGNGQMLEQVFLLVHADHMSSPERLRQACEMICCMAGEVIGLGHHRVEVGAAANLVVHPLADMVELIRLRPRPFAVLHSGRLVAGTAM
jgi:cytosine deaminase